MTGNGDPTILRRRLGMELRRLREEAGHTLEQTAEHLECSVATAGRIELGRGGAHPLRVRALLELFGANETDVESLLSLSRQSRTKGWWQAYSDALPEWFQGYVGLENAASSLSNYEVEFIPGLLQTHEYIRAVHRAGSPNATDEEIERQVDVRLARQEVLRREKPPILWVVINELALRRPVGEHTTMRKQLDELVKRSKRPNITIQVLPIDTGAHAGMLGAFMMLEFPQDTDRDVVYLENLAGALYLEKEHELARYRLAFDHLRASALSPQASVQLIKEVALQHE